MTYKAVLRSAMVNFSDPKMVAEYLKHGWKVIDWTGKQVSFDKKGTVTVNPEKPVYQKK